MNKCEVLTIMMREDNQTAEDIFALVTMLSEQLSRNAIKFSPGEFSSFLSAGAALYQLGLARYGRYEAMNGLFPPNETWPDGPGTKLPKLRHS